MVGGAERAMRRSSIVCVRWVMRSREMVCGFGT